MVGLACSALAQLPPAAAAAPDTATATFGWSSPAAAPSALTLWPEDALFGQDVFLILDHASGVQPQPLDSLTVDVPWIELVTTPVRPGDLPLPPSEGPRQLARLRVYREGPWRPVWQDGPRSEVQLVQGRVDDPTAVEPVRDPRAIGGVPAWLVVLVTGLILLGIMALLIWRWRARRRAWQPVHRDLGPPAWLAAARALQELEQESLLAREQLDTLARILRCYIHGRFHVAAEEMTAPELMTAALAAGWHHEVVAGLAELLARCDDARYAPARVGSQDVHQAMSLALDLIDEVRIQPVWTPVPAADLAAATAAWDRLRRRYPSREVAPC